MGKDCARQPRGSPRLASELGCRRSVMPCAVQRAYCFEPRRPCRGTVMQCRSAAGAAPSNEIPPETNCSQNTLQDDPTQDVRHGVPGQGAQPSDCGRELAGATSGTKAACDAWHYDAKQATRPRRARPDEPHGTWRVCGDAHGSIIPTPQSVGKHPIKVFLLSSRPA